MKDSDETLDKKYQSERFKRNATLSWVFELYKRSDAIIYAASYGSFAWACGFLVYMLLRNLL